MWIDPGIGFGKTVDHNLALLARWPTWWPPGYPVLVGTSRKSFLGVAGRRPAAPRRRSTSGCRASLATATWAMAAGGRDGPGPRRGRHRPGRRLVGAGRSAPGRRPVSRDPEVERERQVGGGHPAPQLHLGHQGPPGHERAAGGFAPNHRKVRRQEEIIWLQVQGFTRVVSLLPSSHNLQAYEERSMASVHFPLPPSGDARGVLGDLYREFHGRLMAGERVLVHQEELGDRMVGWWPATCCGRNACPAGRRPSPSSST